MLRAVTLAAALSGAAAGAPSGYNSGVWQLRKEANYGETRMEFDGTSGNMDGLANANGYWYPDGVEDQRNEMFCGVNMLKEGVITVDDIESGFLCEYDPVTRDMCLPATMMDQFVQTHADAVAGWTGDDPFSLSNFTTSSYITGGPHAANYFSKNSTFYNYLVEVTGNFSAAQAGVRGPGFGGRAQMREHIAGSWMPQNGKQYVLPEYFGYLEINGHNPMMVNYNGYNKVTGIDLRGLNSACGNLGTSEAPVWWYEGDLLDVDNADSEDFMSPLEMGGVSISHLNSLKFIDLSDLKVAGLVQIYMVPELEDLNVDALIAAHTININHAPLLRSIYMPNLQVSYEVDIGMGMINLMDVVLPKYAGGKHGGNYEAISVGNEGTSKNLQMVVVGCVHSADSLSRTEGSTVSQATLANITEYDYIGWDYMVNLFEGVQQTESGPGLNISQAVARPDINPAADFDGKDLTDIIDPTMHRMPSWEQIMVGASESGLPNGDAAEGYGFIEYCGDETFQYDRIHDWGEVSQSFRMNVRCDVNRNPDQLALGHTYAAVVELQNAGAHNQVLLAWARNSGTAMWSPSKKCSHESKLNAIDERGGQMARGRADADGYVKFRQYLEKCDTYVYQAIADPNNAGCELSKMVYGQSPRGNGLVAGPADMRARGKAGKSKFDLRPYTKTGNGEWPYAVGTFNRTDAVM